MTALPNQQQANEALVLLKHTIVDGNWCHLPFELTRDGQGYHERRILDDDPEINRLLAEIEAGWLSKVKK